MGALATVKDALKTAVEAVVPTGTAVLVGVEPESVDVQQYPDFVVIVLENLEYEENITCMTVTQWSQWEWSLYFRCGHAGTDEDAIDRADALHEALLGLADTRAESLSSKIEIRNAAEFVGWAGASPVYRVGIWHDRKPE